MYKLDTETARRMLNGCRDTAEVLRDSIEIGKKTTEALSRPMSEMLFVNEETGDETLFTNKTYDLEPMQSKISRNEERLATVEQTIRELLDENPELRE